MINMALAAFIWAVIVTPFCFFKDAEVREIARYLAIGLWTLTILGVIGVLAGA